MATSSLKKSFSVKTKEEVENLAKLFLNENKQKPLKDLKIEVLSQDRLAELIDAQSK